MSKLVYYKVITPDTVERSEPQYTKLVTTDVKENKPEYVNYSGTHQCLDEFMMKFVGASTKFSELWNSSRIYWQYCMARLKLSADSVSTKMCLWNFNTTTLTARCIIHNDVVCAELESSNLTITTKLLGHAKQTRLRYFNDQKERSMQRV